jgi:hypothetical protein
LFWVFCLCTKNIGLILASILPGIFSFFLSIYVLLHTLRIW